MAKVINKENKTQIEILEIGQELLSSRGFSGVGLAQILKAAQVPKGSFYHYFSSKEDFGQEVILYYFENYLKRVDDLLEADQGTGLQRVLGYFTRWLESQSCNSPDQKCLVVKLSAEVSDLSEKMRSALQKGSSDVVFKIREVIEQGIEDGSISKQCASSSARLLYNMWLGASLMAKLNKNEQELEQCLEQTKVILTTSKVI